MAVHSSRPASPGPGSRPLERIEISPRTNKVAKSLPLDDFHHDVELTVALAGVVDRDVAGWFSADASLASCSKRLMAAAVEAALMLRTLMATLRASFGSQAR